MGMRRERRVGMRGLPDLRRIRWLVLFLPFVFTLPLAHAETDKSAMRPSVLKLPKGPGSLQGVGENVEPSLNKGEATYGIPIALPSGHAGLTPSLRLSYSSGAGSSVLGMGWSLSLPRIERMTARGLPRYTSEDTFVGLGGEELVPLSDGRTYRARFEGKFLRYTWFEAGPAGYWRVEYGDGRVGYFGATASGEVVPEARLESRAGQVFRYHLVEMQDALGHSIRYTYRRCVAAEDAALCPPYMMSIDWTFVEGVPHYSATLAYEKRADRLSDAKPAFEVRTTQRLREITVWVANVKRRRYVLEYEDMRQARGLSRLSSVTSFGLKYSGAYPVKPRFVYSGTMLDERPRVQFMGSMGVAFAAGFADLVDLNSDGLPEIIDTRDGVHYIHENILEQTGAHFFSPDVKQSAMAGSGAFDLSSPYVSMADIDGDGHGDMVDLKNASVLWNRGEGDWQVGSVQGLPVQPLSGSLRFFDYNHDKKIDLIDIQSGSCQYYLSDGSGGFSAGPAGEALVSDALEASALKFVDMNGDGMVDVARAMYGEVQYRLYLGYGRFTVWRVMGGLPDGLSSDALYFADINGDGLSDVIDLNGVAAPSDIRVYLNQNGEEFYPFPLLSTLEPDSDDFPDTQGASVRFADMNGNGSTDIVWLQNPSGEVSYLEFFPQRPNLLKEVRNGIGQVILLDYGSSTVHRLNGGEQWSLPYPVATLDSTVLYAQSSGARQVQRFSYANGHYDAVERQFRGFADVVVYSDGDADTEAARTSYVFNVGINDAYRSGLLEQQTQQSAERVLSIVRHHYADCPVWGSENAAGPYAIRYICLEQTEEEIQEGLADTVWVRKRTEYSYDGYGNRIFQASLGVVEGASCGGPCGGDEVYTATDYVQPRDVNGSGHWLIHAPYRERSYGVLGGPATETLTYYDGAAFVGLELGKVGAGLPTRITQRVNQDGFVVETARRRFDAHGNVVEELDANGHRRGIVYNATGLLPVAEEMYFDGGGLDAGLEAGFDGAAGSPYVLRQELSYDEVLELPVRSTAWMRIEGSGAPGATAGAVGDAFGDATGDARATLYAYDLHGRLSAIARPGDTLERPTQSYAYRLAWPSSAILVSGRSVAGTSSPDMESLLCFDGLGRPLQTRTQVEPGRYLVDGFKDYNVQGEVRRLYYPYESSGNSCALEGAGDLYVETYRDAAKRVIRERYPDELLYGGEASTKEVRYGPLYRVEYDAEDMDSQSPQYNTPRISYVDGQGRPVQYQWLLAAEGQPLSTAYSYDSLGRLAQVVDDQGNTKTYNYDLLGRLLEVNDPDAGVLRYGYDAVGDLISSIDGRGVEVRRKYDEANRLVAQWSVDDKPGTLVRYRFDGGANGSGASGSGASGSGANGSGAGGSGAGGSGAGGSQCAECTNSAGQLWSVRYPLGTASPGEFGEDRFGYDARGNVRYSSRSLLGLELAHRYEFDNADRLTSTTFPDGRRIERFLDNAGRVMGIPGFVDDVGYNPAGDVDFFRLGNNTLTNFGYDDLRRLRSINVRDSEGQRLLQYVYQRDRVGNILKIEDFRTDKLPSDNTRFSYDALYRLRETIFDNGEGAFGEVLSMTYDSIDNITSKRSTLKRSSPAHVGEYNYGVYTGDSAGPHALRLAGGIELFYDASGNAIKHGYETLSWDHLGRLQEVKRGPQWRTRYSYGPGADRVIKREDSHTILYFGDDYEIRDGISITYVRLMGRRVAQIEEPVYAAELLPDIGPISAPDGMIDAADVAVAVSEGYPIDIVDQLLSAAQMRNVAGYERSERYAGRVTYLHHDQQGSVTLSTADNGYATVRDRTAYYPFGAIRFQQTSLPNYSWTGQERDAQVGLSYHSVRYFDPLIARWISPDPLFVTPGKHTFERPREAMNPYGYVRNNPVNGVDPSGQIEVNPGIAYAKVYIEGRNAGLSHQDARGIALESKAAEAGAQGVIGGFIWDAFGDTAADAVELVKSVVSGDGAGVAWAAGALILPGLSARAARKIAGAAGDVARGRRLSKAGFRGPKANGFDWGHIMDRHSAGGRIARQRANRSQVFQGLSEKQIKSRVQSAWKNRGRIMTQTDPSGVTRVRYRGVDARSGASVDFWQNQTTGIVETAFPSP